MEMVEINLKNPIINIKKSLATASQLENYELFALHEVIKNNLDPSSCCSALELHGLDSPMSVFEMACSSNTHGSGYFIKECISIGCDTSKQNPKCGRRPISFAVEKFYAENLEILLSDTNVSVDVDHSYAFPFAPINYLLEHVSVDAYTFEQIFLCMELLVQHCADVNLPGTGGKTPIRNILLNERLNEEQKKRLVQCIFDHAKYVDIDGDNGVTRHQLSQLIPDLELPPAGIQRETSLADGNEIEFWKNVAINRNKNENFWHAALMLAVQSGLIYSVERILRSGFIITMHALDDKKEPLLETAIRHIEWGDNGKPNNEKCLSLFLNHRKIDINAESVVGDTALQFSISRNLSCLTMKLLERGAYIGRSGWGYVEISDIQPQRLERHLDSCLSLCDDDERVRHLQITFDYKNLIPLHCRITPPDRANKFSEMKAIECIKDTRTLRHLLKHPLIACFIDLKWKLLALLFYVNFFFCALFAVLNILYILIFFLEAIESPIAYRVGLMAFLIWMTAREIIQMISSPGAYLKSCQNIVECILIGLSIFILFDSCPIELRGSVAAVTILLFAYEISVLTGSLPIRSFAIHYVMLETVATNFFTSLLSYSTIIFAFALAFYSLFHKIQPDEASDDDDDDDEMEKKYSQFQGLSLAILKSFVMANGELDRSSIPFDDNPLSYIVFVAFMLIVTTVLGNLLGGLAVSDINEIREQAELTYLLRRCEVLAHYEKTYPNWLKWFPKLDAFVRSRVYLYTDYSSKYQRSFFSHDPMTGLKKLIKYIYDPHIDEDILKEALKIVSLDNNEENETEMLRKQISKMDESIGQRMSAMEIMFAELQNNMKRM